MSDAESHLPDHGSREVLIIFSSLTTTDPTNIHSTIDALVQDRVRVNIVGLSAEISVCREICRRTKGKFSVAMDEAHLKDLLFEVVPPQPTEEGGQTVGGSSGNATSNPGPKADLMQMGFPMMQASQLPVLCACHSKLKYNGFICPRCKSKVCEIPTECPVCSLSIVSSPHLARSYRHLFPVPNFLEVNGSVRRCEGTPDADRPVADPSKLKTGCFACGTPFSTATTLDGEPEPTSGIASSRTSSNARYECPKCHQHFCLECDVFTHDVLGVCSGCGGSA